MARIRTIKPEFWDSPSTARASTWARLAYIAMWNWADDHGRGTANLKELEGFIFPNDTFPVGDHGNTVHFRDVVAEVSECFGVVFYEVDGRPYYAIPSWERHQRNERRAKESKYPEPTPPTRGNARNHGNTVHLRDEGAEIPNISGPGTGEQGNRGTDTSSASTAVEREFEEWWSEYPRKKDKGHAFKAYKAARKKTSCAVMLEGLRRQADWLKAKGEFAPYGATWLNGQRWLDQPDHPDMNRPNRGGLRPEQWQVAAQEAAEFDRLQAERNAS